MIRELLTLVIEKTPVQYYIRFSRERNDFNFQPTLKNKAAPSFTITNKAGEWVCAEKIDSLVLNQAIKKIKEICTDSIFDNL